MVIPYILSTPGEAEELGDELMGANQALIK